MRVTSLGFRTDIALRTLEGSQISEHPGYLAIRTPGNPDFRWGNFLLLREPPEPASASGWTQTFAREFPAADYVALGIDVARADQADTAGFARLGFRPQVTAVLTATDVRPPPRPNERVSLRPLATDEDWRRAHEVALASNPGGPGHREFLERRMAEKRRLAESDGDAIRIYRSVGFAQTQQQVSVERLASSTPAASTR